MKKINIYINGKYECSTNSSKTCKEARTRYIALYGGIKPLRLDYTPYDRVIPTGHLEGKLIKASYN